MNSREEHILAWLNLSRIPDIGPVLGRRLVAGLGSPQSVLEAGQSALIEINGIGEKISAQIRSYRDDGWAEEELERCMKEGIRIITLDDREYPELLRDLPDPPLLLYCKGGLPADDCARVAVVGCRGPDEYGRVMARRIGAGLAEVGVTVVSGLALGVDGIAQESAIKAGGRSIAVLGTGADVVYPLENRGVYEACIAAGAAISEFPLGTKPAPENFPRRNRIISGLCMGLVLVQAMSERSGALITVRYALEQGREVFVVPDRAGTRGGRVMNRLIRQGARLVENANDIIEDLAPQVPVLLKESPASEKEAKEIFRPRLQEGEQRIYSLIPIPAEGQIQMDDIVRQSGLSSAAAGAVLLKLELAGLIYRLPGNSYVRTEV